MIFINGYLLSVSISPIWYFSKTFSSITTGTHRSLATIAKCERDHPFWDMIPSIRSKYFTISGDRNRVKRITGLGKSSIFSVKTKVQLRELHEAQIKSFFSCFQVSFFRELHQSWENRDHDNRRHYYLARFSEVFFL